MVLKKDAIADEKAIIANLEGRLAKFKLPKRVIFVDDLPRNTMGKVQKNVLAGAERETLHLRDINTACAICFSE